MVYSFHQTEKILAIISLNISFCPPLSPLSQALQYTCLKLHDSLGLFPRLFFLVFFLYIFCCYVFTFTHLFFAYSDANPTPCVFHSKHSRFHSRPSVCGTVNALGLTLLSTSPLGHRRTVAVAAFVSGLPVLCVLARLSAASSCLPGPGSPLCLGPSQLSAVPPLGKPWRSGSRPVPKQSAGAVVGLTSSVLL